MDLVSQNWSITQFESILKQDLWQKPDNFLIGSLGQPSMPSIHPTIPFNFEGKRLKCEGKKKRGIFAGKLQTRAGIIKKDFTKELIHLWQV